MQANSICNLAKGMACDLVAEQELQEQKTEDGKGLRLACIGFNGYLKLPLYPPVIKKPLP